MLQSLMAALRTARLNPGNQVNVQAVCGLKSRQMCCMAYPQYRFVSHRK